jgi:hypothetical protein
VVYFDRSFRQTHKSPTKTIPSAITLAQFAGLALNPLAAHIGSMVKFPLRVKRRN